GSTHSGSQKRPPPLWRYPTGPARTGFLFGGGASGGQSGTSPSFQRGRGAPRPLIFSRGVGGLEKAGKSAGWRCSVCGRGCGAAPETAGSASERSQSQQQGGQR